jgi:hypothetical protein
MANTPGEHHKWIANNWEDVISCIRAQEEHSEILLHPLKALVRWMPTLTATSGCGFSVSQRVEFAFPTRLAP